jgi:hypothetical protein
MGTYVRKWWPNSTCGIFLKIPPPETVNFVSEATWAEFEWVGGIGKNVTMPGVRGGFDRTPRRPGYLSRDPEMA